MTPACHTPKRGWAFRWAHRGGALVLRRLPAILGILFCLHAAALILVHLASGSPPRALMATVAIEWLTFFHFAAILHVLMDADGRRADHGFFSRRTVMAVAPLIGISVALFLVFTVIAALAGANLQTAPEPRRFAHVLGFTISLVQMGQTDGGIIFTLAGLFYLPLAIALGRTFSGHLSDQRTVRRALGFGTFIVPVLVCVVGAFASWVPVIAPLFWVFVVAWSYAGAREMFAGLADNGADPRAIRSRKETAVPGLDHHI